MGCREAATHEVDQFVLAGQLAAAEPGDHAGAQGWNCDAACAARRTVGSALHVEGLSVSASGAESLSRVRRLARCRNFWACLRARPA